MGAIIPEYVGILNESNKWAMLIQYWNMTLFQLETHFEGCVDGVLDM